MNGVKTLNRSACLSVLVRQSSDTKPSGPVGIGRIKRKTMLGDETNIVAVDVE